MIGRSAPPFLSASLPDVKKHFPNRIALVLAIIAFVLIAGAIGLNYCRGGEIAYAHVLFALGLLAFVVWFSGRLKRVD